jgi:molybdate transport system substrate-binding protein
VKGAGSPRRVGAALFLLAALAAVAGCGGDGEARGERERLVVSAAASLKEPFTTYGDVFDGATVRLSFAGSDELAAQIRQGVRPAVFAAANTKLPDALHAEGLVERPVVFATNALVLAVPSGETRIRRTEHLAHPGIKLAIGAEGVPVGDYARELLERLPREQRRAILANVRSEEPDVNGIVGKLVQGAADAGFVYRTDVTATDGRLRAIPLPASDVRYGVAVVRGTPNRAQAQAFVDGLVRGQGAEVLRTAGFGPAP